MLVVNKEWNQENQKGLLIYLDIKVVIGSRLRMTKFMLPIYLDIKVLYGSEVKMIK